MRTLGQLIDHHAGRAGIVLGGAPSLPREQSAARRMYPDAVLASVNHHGCLLATETWAGKGSLWERRRELGDPEWTDPVICDYAVTLDDWRDYFPDLRHFLPLGTLTVEPRSEADVRLVEFPRGTGNSAMLAAWVLYMLGCAPIIVCGVECYAGGTYWHDAEAESSGNSSSPDYHLAEWARRLPQFMERDLVRAAGGPLVQLYGEAEPGLDLRALHRELRPELRLRFRKDTPVGGHLYQEGEEDVFAYKQARWLLGADRADLV